jgi:hypothetical protein
VGDANGHWVSCIEVGDVINFWRYDPGARRLFVAYSLAFSDHAEYVRVMGAIEAAA